MRRVAALAIAADHPSFAGHFPGMPILPGVVLLDAALRTIGAELDLDLATCRLASAKFHAVSRPGDRLRVEFEIMPNASIRFSVHNDTDALATGSLSAHVG